MSGVSSVRTTRVDVISASATRNGELQLTFRIGQPRQYYSVRIRIDELNVIGGRQDIFARAVFGGLIKSAEMSAKRPKR